MKITNIEFTARRTFNHPTEKFANFQFSIRLSVELKPICNEEVTCAYDDLRTLAENMAETHKQEILEELDCNRKREALTSSIQTAQAAPARIARLRTTLEDPGLTKWARGDAESSIEALESIIRSLPEYEKELAALPAPKLLPAPTLHPGHPDHPDTDANPYFGE